MERAKAFRIPIPCFVCEGGLDKLLLNLLREYNCFPTVIRGAFRKSVVQPLKLEGFPESFFTAPRLPEPLLRPIIDSAMKMGMERTIVEIQKSSTKTPPPPSPAT